jgi:hypothetical protein
VVAGEGVIGRRLVTELQTAGDLGRVDVRQAGFRAQCSSALPTGLRFSHVVSGQERPSTKSHLVWWHKFFTKLIGRISIAKILQGTKLEGRRVRDFDFREVGAH